MDDKTKESTDPRWLQWLAILESQRPDEAAALAPLALSLYDCTEAGLDASALLGVLVTSGRSDETRARIERLGKRLEQLGKRLVRCAR